MLDPIDVVFCWFVVDYETDVAILLLLLFALCNCYIKAAGDCTLAYVIEGYCVSSWSRVHALCLLMFSRIPPLLC